MFGSSEEPEALDHVEDRARRRRVDPAQGDGHDLGAGGRERRLHLLERAKAAGADDQPRAPAPAAELERSLPVVQVVRSTQPPWIAASTSTRWPVAQRGRVPLAARGTTSPSTATATPRPPPGVDARALDGIGHASRRRRARRARRSARSSSPRRRREAPAGANGASSSGAPRRRAAPRRVGGQRRQQHPVAEVAGGEEQPVDRARADQRRVVRGARAQPGARLESSSSAISGQQPGRPRAAARGRPPRSPWCRSRAPRRSRRRPAGRPRAAPGRRARRRRSARRPARRRARERQDLALDRPHRRSRRAREASPALLTSSRPRATTSPRRCSLPSAVTTPRRRPPSRIGCRDLGAGADLAARCLDAAAQRREQGLRVDGGLVRGARAAADAAREPGLELPAGRPAQPLGVEPERAHELVPAPQLARPRRGRAPRAARRSAGSRSRGRSPPRARRRTRASAAREARPSSSSASSPQLASPTGASIPAATSGRAGARVARARARRRAARAGPRARPQARPITPPPTITASSPVASRAGRATTPPFASKSFERHLRGGALRNLPAPALPGSGSDGRRPRCRPLSPLRPGLPLTSPHRTPGAQRSRVPQLPDTDARERGAAAGDRGLRRGLERAAHGHLLRGRDARRRRRLVELHRPASWRLRGAGGAAAGIRSVRGVVRRGRLASPRPRLADPGPRGVLDGARRSRPRQRRGDDRTGRAGVALCRREGEEAEGLPGAPRGALLGAPRGARRRPALLRDRWARRSPERPAGRAGGARGRRRRRPAPRPRTRRRRARRDSRDVPGGDRDSRCALPGERRPRACRPVRRRRRPRGPGGRGRGTTLAG